MKIDIFFLNAQQAPDYLNLPISRIRYEVFRKRIPFIKIGATVRFSKPDLDQWIESQKKGG